MREMVDLSIEERVDEEISTAFNYSLKKVTRLYKGAKNQIREEQ